MKAKLPLIGTIAFLLLTQITWAQDKLYWANGEVTEAAIVEILDNIKYKDHRGTTRSFGKENFVLLVNKKGDFLAIEELNKMSQKNEAEARERFLSGVGVQREPAKFDIILKKNTVEQITPIKVLKGDISYESDEVVNFKNTRDNPESINKNELLCIIYKNGEHNLLTSSMIVADYIDEIRTALADAEKATTTGSGNMKLTSEQVAEFGQKGIDKVTRFSQYLNIIVNKSNSDASRNEAIEQACELFLSNARIEVSSVNRNGSNKQPIRKYLDNLKLLPYDEVNVSWSQIAYVRDLTEEKDGTYSGLISAYQTFEGIKDSGIEYQDVTKKEAKVKLQRYDKQKDGKMNKEWDVMIGDIRVVETKRN